MSTLQLIACKCPRTPPAVYMAVAEQMSLGWVIHLLSLLLHFFLAAVWACWSGTYICLAVTALRLREVTNGSDHMVKLCLNLACIRVVGVLEDRAQLPLQFWSFQAAASLKALDVMTRGKHDSRRMLGSLLGNHLSHVDRASEMTLAGITMVAITTAQSFPWHKKPVL